MANYIEDEARRPPCPEHGQPMVRGRRVVLETGEPGPWEWMCACTFGAAAVIGDDPDRDRRRAAYAERERRRVVRALDRYIEVMNGPDLDAGATRAVAGDRFIEAVGDYVLARLDRCADGGNLCTNDNCPCRLQHKSHYGVPERSCCGTPAMAQVPHDELCDPAHRNVDYGARVPDRTGAYSDMCSQLPSCRDGEHSESCEVSIYRAQNPDHGAPALPTSGRFPAADFAGRVKEVLVSKAVGHVMVGYSVGIETGRFTRDLPGIRFIDPIRVGGSKFINGSWTSILDTAGEAVTMTNSTTVWIADPAAVDGAPEAAAGDL